MFDSLFVYKYLC